MKITKEKKMDYVILAIALIIIIGIGGYLRKKEQKKREKWDFRNSRTEIPGATETDPNTELAYEKARVAQGYFEEGYLPESAELWLEAAELIQNAAPKQAAVWRTKALEAETLGKQLHEKV